MIYEEKIHVPSSTKTVKHEIAPCVKCGCENIKIEEYEDRYGYISTATCTGCKRSTKENTGASAIIRSWNKQNDIETLIADKTKLIEETMSEIKALKELKKQRQKPEKLRRSNRQPEPA